MTNITVNEGVFPYQYEGLKGRYGYWPKSSRQAKRLFVVVYGQHASLERLKPLVAIFREFGDVYAVDNPGFGGMEAPYKIGAYPDLVFQARHLRNFINTHVPQKKLITFVGISYGFQIVAQLLNDFPELQTRTETVINLMGSASTSDLHLPASYKVPLVYLLSSWARTKPGSMLFRLVARRWLIVAIYLATKPIQVKLKRVSWRQSVVYAREQAKLWVDNDPRTHAAAGWDFVMNNDVSHYRIPVPAIFLGTPQDHIFDSESVKTKMRAMFERLASFDLQIENHAPLDIDDQSVEAIIPKGLSKMLQSSNNSQAESSK